MSSKHFSFLLLTVFFLTDCHGQKQKTCASCLKKLELLEGKIDSLSRKLDSAIQKVSDIENYQRSLKDSIKNLHPIVVNLKDSTSNRKAKSEEKKNTGTSEKTKTQSIDAKRLVFQNKEYIVLVVDPACNEVNLYNEKGVNQFHNFKSIKNSLNTKNKELIFAMNAGMFEPGRTPLGLYVVNGQVLNPLNLKKPSGNRTGNFYDLPPSGVFALDKDNDAHVIPSSQYTQLSKDKDIQTATQSGPMMVRNGEINKHFTPGSRNLNIRNAVGVTKNGFIVFAISTQPVNFYEFSSFFRDVLNCENSLYLDGAISRIYLPELDETNLYNNANLGPIITIEKNK